MLQGLGVGVGRVHEGLADHRAWRDPTGCTQRVLVGFAVGAGSGPLLGGLRGLSRPVRSVLGPTIAALDHVDRHLVEVGRAYGRRGVPPFLQVQLPAIAPATLCPAVILLALLGQLTDGLFGLLERAVLHRFSCTEDTGSPLCQRCRRRRWTGAAPHQERRWARSLRRRFLTSTPVRLFAKQVDVPEVA